MPDSAEQLSDALATISHGVALGRFGAYSLWWTPGSERVAPSLLACAGLPPAEGFAALLTGAWQESGVWLDWFALKPVSSSAETAGNTSRSP